MVYTGGDAWVAVGPAADSDGKMVGSEVVMGLPSPSNTVMKYELTQQGAAGVNAMGAQTLTGTSLSAAGGTTTMTYTKLLAEAGELPYSDSGPTPLVFAVGSGTSLGYHDARSPPHSPPPHSRARSLFAAAARPPRCTRSCPGTAPLPPQDPH